MARSASKRSRWPAIFASSASSSLVRVSRSFYYMILIKIGIVHDKPTVAVASAFLKHASRVDVIKDHGYICAAICNGSEVGVCCCPSIDGSDV